MPASTPHWMRPLVLAAGALTAAACASADAPATPPPAAPPPSTPAPSPTPAPAPAPAPALPILAPFETSGDPAFDAWRDDFASRAVAAGRSEGMVRAVLTGLEPLTFASAAMVDQPEFSKPIWDYVASATAPTRVSTGQQKLGETPDLFAAIETAHGPPREILTAIWGMETSYGAILGDFDSPRALATLAYQGRRTALGESQLLATIQLLEQGRVTRADLGRASWAGAMGQTQFMPTTFLGYAVDWDGDNRIDLWDNEGDALASAANYLAESGWRRGEPWAVEVTLPEDFNYALSDGAYRSAGQWGRLGVAPATALVLAPDPGSEAELFLPAGAYGPAFLLFENFKVIKTYNNADSYALSVGLLADKLAGRPDLSRAWPTDLQLLSSTEIRILQDRLNTLGYGAGTVDGLAGRRTRAALQDFQNDRGLRADGFPTAEMLGLVVQAAGG